jgi:DNA-binding CsgD family transcriptional regulator
MEEIDGLARGVPSIETDSMVIAPIVQESGRRFLGERAPGLPAEVAAALVALAGDHPAALAELARSLTPEQLRGDAPPPSTLPPGSEVGRGCRAALAELPDRTAHLLLLAATDPDLTLAELMETAAAAQAGSPAGDLAPAEDLGLLLVTEDAIQFSPVVLRSIVYFDAPLGRRQAAHTVLADVLQRRGQLLRSLLHRAAVSFPADENLAGALRLAARDGPPRLASAALRYAAELTACPEAAASTLVDAARQAWLAGERQHATHLLRRAGRAPAVRARSRLLTGEMELRAGGASRETLLEAAAHLVPHDIAAALDALLLAGEAVHLAGDHDRYAQVARLALALRRGAEPPPLALAFHHVAGLAAMIAGDHDIAFDRLRTVLDLAGAVQQPAALIRAATAGILIGDGPAARALAARAIGLARQDGAAALVPQALELAAFAGLSAGRYEAATAAATEGVLLAGATAQPELAESHLGILAVLAALVGDRPATMLRIKQAGAHDSAGGSGQARALCEWALALLDLVEGEPRSCADRLRAIMLTPAGRGNRIVQVAATPHLIEAVWRCGLASRGPAGAAIGDPFDRWAAGTGQAAWLALRSRCRALLAEETEDAESHFREALRQHGRGDTGFARAHTELLFGRDLRRRRRPGAAREHLRSAVQTFRLLDAGPWAVQADVELRAAGASVPDRPSPGALTAQQERIARLVADGATNREVAQQLFLSPRTIDHHLRNVYLRLGVRSRTELARRLAS